MTYVLSLVYLESFGILLCLLSTSYGLNQHFLRVNDLINIKFASLSDKGEGQIELNDGMKLFVPNVLPNESALIRIERIKNRKSWGNVVSRLNDSSIRIEPTCDHSSTCGGCQMQHMNYNSQLEYKKSLILEAFSEYSTTDKLDVLPVIPSLSIFQYRNKLQFAVKKTQDKIAIGLYGTNSHDVVDTKECVIQHPLTNAVLQRIRQFLTVHRDRLSIYDESNHSGSIRHVVIRTAFNTNESLVCLVSSDDSPNCLGEFFDSVASIAGVVGVLLNVNPYRNDVVLNQDPNATRLLVGRDHLIDRIAGVRVKISLHSFVQSNPSQAAVLYRSVLDMIPKPTEQCRVMDLYCGMGIIGLYLSSHVKEVIGVEDCSPAVDDARENADLNDRTNIEFVLGKAEEVFPRILARWRQSTVLQRVNRLRKAGQSIIVLNPPRKGCDAKLIKAVGDTRFDVIYVSCNPKTLARDLNLFVTDCEYRINKVQPVDMFPHMYHVEVIVSLSFEVGRPS